VRHLFVRLPLVRAVEYRRRTQNNGPSRFAWASISRLAEKRPSPCRSAQEKKSPVPLIIFRTLSAVSGSYPSRKDWCISSSPGSGNDDRRVVRSRHSLAFALPVVHRDRHITANCSERASRWRRFSTRRPSSRGWLITKGRNTARAHTRAQRLRHRQKGMRLERKAPGPVPLRVRLVRRDRGGGRALLHWAGRVDDRGLGGSRCTNATEKRALRSTSSAATSLTRCRVGASLLRRRAPGPQHPDGPVGPLRVTSGSRDKGSAASANRLGSRSSPLGLGAAHETAPPRRPRVQLAIPDGPSRFVIPTRVPGAARSSTQSGINVVTVGEIYEGRLAAALAAAVHRSSSGRPPGPRADREGLRARQWPS